MSPRARLRVPTSLVCIQREPKLGTETLLGFIERVQSLNHDAAASRGTDTPPTRCWMPASHRSGYALGLLCLACYACDLQPGEHGHLFAGVDADASGRGTPPEEREKRKNAAPRGSANADEETSTSY
jgi:hypothetical protein